MSDTWKQVRIEQLAELERKAAALDWLEASKADVERMDDKCIIQWGVAGVIVTAEPLLETAERAKAASGALEAEAKP